MNGLSSGEILLYGGLAGMGIAVVLALAAAVVFAVTGRKLAEKLEEDYGKPKY